MSYEPADEGWISHGTGQGPSTNSARPAVAGHFRLVAMAPLISPPRRRYERLSWDRPQKDVSPWLADTCCDSAVALRLHYRHAAWVKSGGRWRVRFIRPREVLEMIGVSRTTLWRMVQSGSFPPPVRITTRNNGFVLEA